MKTLWNPMETDGMFMTFPMFWWLRNTEARIERAQVIWDAAWFRHWNDESY